MSRLDDELKIALRREEPPPGFVERVLARADSRRPCHLWWAAAIASAVLLAAGVEFEHHRRVRVEGEQARARVMLALQITGSKLQFIKEKVNAIDSARH